MSGSLVSRGGVYLCPNGSWVMVTWGPPSEQDERQISVKTSPSCNFSGGNICVCPSTFIMHKGDACK